MTTDLATRDGYTEAVIADNHHYTLSLLIMPDTDLDGRFKAYDCDEHEWLYVNGWTFSFERAEAGQ